MKMADIPQSFMDSVRNGLKHFLVPLFGQSGKGGASDFRPIGSGTLVRIDDTHGILTAAHVWRRLENSEKIHVIQSDRKPSSFSILPEHISPKTIWGGENSEWGPDLAFLELAPNDVSTMSASKSFLNLSQQKSALAESPPNIEKGLWVITGLVEEFSDVQNKPEERIITANADCQAFFSTIHKTYEHQEYDYFDAGANKELDGVPASFGGVSGGGLWQVDLSKNKAGEIYWNGKRYFRGIAFWELEASESLKAIRLHGPQSIFETAWVVWGFPS